MRRALPCRCLDSSTRPWHRASESADVFRVIRDRPAIRRAEPGALRTDYCGVNGEQRAARYMVADDYGSAPEHLCQECMQEADRMREPRGLEFYAPRGAAPLRNL